MKAVLKDGSAIDCESFKVTEKGTFLYGDEDHAECLGFIPSDELRVIAPDDYEPKDRDSRTVRRNDGGSDETP